MEELLARDNVTINEIDQNLSLDELNNAIKGLKSGKSGGNDSIINEFIINAPSYIKNYSFQFLIIFLN